MNRFIFFAFVVWRISLFIIAFLAPLAISIFGAKFPYWQELLVSTGLPSWMWSFGNFDGVHYITIAKTGYAAQFTQAFFPLYPIIIRIVSVFTLGNVFLAGLLVSNVSTLLFLILFAKLLHLADFSMRSIRWTILFTLVFPFSFFFGSIYNESFFLCLVLGAFLAARKNRWFLAGLFGCLASLTRLVGVFLLPALVIEFYQQRKIFNLQSSIFNLLFLFFIPMGLFLYMIYLGLSFQDPLYFIHAQPVFGASRSSGEMIFLPQVIWRYLRIFTTVPLGNYDFWVASWEFVTTGMFILIFSLKARKIPLSEMVFSLLSVLMPTLTGTFSSMPRYILVAFPLFYLHGLIKKKWIKIGLFCVYAVLLVLFTSLFTRGYWVS